MGLFKDISDTLRDLDIKGGVESYVSSKKYSSLSKRAAEGTLQFPLLVSRAIDIETAQMISKALERQYSTFVQIVLSMAPVADISKHKDAASYLRQFHQNSGIKSDMNDVFNAATDLIESYNLAFNDVESCIIASKVYEASTGNLVADNKKQLFNIYENVRLDALNNKFRPQKKIYKFSDPNLTAHHNAVKEDSHDQIFNNDGDIDGSTNFNLTKGAGGVTVNNYGTKPTGGTRTPSLRDMDIKLSDNILKDNDVKKSNELIATTLHVRLHLVNDKSEDVGFQDFVIGIKTIMHPIKSDEMQINLVNGCRNTNTFFNFLRWTTGELTFFKDLLFNINGIKEDVVKRSGGASPWWIALKRRRALAKLKDATLLPNKMLPNCGIVISMEEAESIKTEYGFDMLEPAIIDKIMKEYFLLSFVVVDNASQIAHFMFDGQSEYQTISFSGLERENSSDERKFKEMLKFVNRN